MALIECKICGHLVSDKATACPNCGEPLYPIHSTEDLSNEVTEVEQQSHGDIYQSQTEPEAESYVYNDNKSESMGNHRGVLIALLLVLLALLGAGGWFVYDSEQKRAKLEQQLAEQAEKARQDSIVAAELMEKQRQDSITKAMKQEQINMIYNEYVKVLKQLRNSENIEFFLFDITKNGIPELWINGFLPEDYSKLPGADEGGDDGNPLSVLTIQNNTAKRIFSLYDEGCYWPSCYYQGSDYIILEGELCGGAPCICKISYHNGVVKCKTIFEDFFNQKPYPKIKEPKLTWYSIHDFNTLKQQIESFF